MLTLITSKLQTVLKPATSTIINNQKQSYFLGPADQLQKAFGKTKAIKQSDEVQGGYNYTYITKVIY